MVAAGLPRSAARTHRGGRPPPFREWIQRQRMPNNLRPFERGATGSRPGCPNHNPRPTQAYRKPSAFHWLSMSTKVGVASISLTRARDSARRARVPLDGSEMLDDFGDCARGDRRPTPIRHNRAWTLAAASTDSGTNTGTVVRRSNKLDAGGFERSLHIKES
jgi:hypothetical protein